jgi:hypothetical protein
LIEKADAIAAALVAAGLGKGPEDMPRAAESSKFILRRFKLKVNSF